MVRVIINSDDLGYSVDINKAIAEGFTRGLIRSSSMLVNFNQGFTDIIDKISTGTVPGEPIGVHLNITQGKPFSEQLRTSGDSLFSPPYSHRNRQYWK